MTRVIRPDRPDGQNPVLGAVSECAPHDTGDEHVPEVEDLMYAYDNNTGNFWLDYGNDDYWGHSNPACPDVVDSVILDPLPAFPQSPPYWT